MFHSLKYSKIFKILIGISFLQIHFDNHKYSIHLKLLFHFTFTQIHFDNHKYLNHYQHCHKSLEDWYDISNERTSLLVSGIHNVIILQ